MPVTILFANNKGGVQKTGCTVQTAAGLARQGLNVLVVDMDPQANATRRLGIEWDPANPIPSVSEAIAANAEGAGEGAVVECGWKNAAGETTAEAKHIDVIPARFDLINREAEAGTVGAFRRLRKALTGWTEDYDVVLIDSRPDLGHLVQMSMSAADVVVIPSDTGYDSVEAAIRVSDFVTQHAVDLANPELRVGGVLVTRRRQTAEGDFQIEGLRERFGDLVWDLRTVKIIPGDVEVELTPPYVPEWTRFAEADAAGVSLTAWNDERGRTTVRIFDEVAQRIIDRILPAYAERIA
ncbi:MULTISPECIES: ParA family protein [Cellulosimicrobium]|jgi:chromosome partitioning protein|uniref:ParA family protein n=1 Tax=Cellulosimicrobium TaxID=157920 RepID=UPI0002DEEDBF|nr:MULTISPECIES: ParA family protein [Cellulosimicrobium]MBE9924868.1 ParA family protein [Cellulosimicrobium cellulans]